MYRFSEIDRGIRMEVYVAIYTKQGEKTLVGVADSYEKAKAMRQNVVPCPSDSWKEMWFGHWRLVGVSDVYFGIYHQEITTIDYDDPEFHVHKNDDRESRSE